MVQAAMTTKIETAIGILTGERHIVRTYMREGQLWYDIDGRTLASSREMEVLADKLYLLLERERVSLRRQSPDQNN
jgi:hypothetical protein